MIPQLPNQGGKVVDSCSHTRKARVDGCMNECRGYWLYETLGRLLWTKWLMCSPCGPWHFSATIIGSNICNMLWDLSICKNRTMLPLVVPKGVISQLLLLGCIKSQVTVTLASGVDTHQSHSGCCALRHTGQRWWSLPTNFTMGSWTVAYPSLPSQRKFNKFLRSFD